MNPSRTNLKSVTYFVFVRYWSKRTGLSPVALPAPSTKHRQKKGPCTSKNRLTLDPLIAFVVPTETPEYGTAFLSNEAELHGCIYKLLFSHKRMNFWKVSFHFLFFFAVSSHTRDESNTGFPLTPPLWVTLGMCRKRMRRNRSPG